MRLNHSSSSDVDVVIGFSTVLVTGFRTVSFSSSDSSSVEEVAGVSTLRATGGKTGRGTGFRISCLISSVSETGGPLVGGPEAGFAGAPSRMRRPPPGGPLDVLTTSEKSGVSSEIGVGSVSYTHLTLPTILLV